MYRNQSHAIMALETLVDADRHTVEEHTETGTLVFRYDQFVAGDALREVAGEWADLVEERGTDRYLVDVRDISAHEDEDKAWLAETWVPNNIENGVRWGAAVHADSAIAKMDNESIEAKLSGIDSRFEYRIFSDEETALDWLASQ